MRKSRKMARCIMMVMVIAAMFSVTALADSSWRASFTYNTQTKESPTVPKNNYNSRAIASSVSGVPDASCALKNGGKIEAYSCSATSGAKSGMMYFNGVGQRDYGAYGSFSYGTDYYLQATLRDCAFSGNYMRQDFNWTP